jgi:hypothetical protein
MRYKFNVFGKIMLVERKNQQWLLFNDAVIGIPTRIYDVVIPDDINANELAKYLDDIYHEYSSEKYSNVFKL